MNLPSIFNINKNNLKDNLNNIMRRAIIEFPNYEIYPPMYHASSNSIIIEGRNRNIVPSCDVVLYNIKCVNY